MSFTKITESDITSNGVQSQENKLTGSAQENKKVFDKLIEDVVAVKFNALIDELLAITAAAQIGADVDGLTSTNVNAALAEIKAIADQAVAAQLTPGIVVTEYLHDGAVTAAKLGTGIKPINVGIKSGTDVPTTADISAGEIYFMYTEDE